MRPKVRKLLFESFQREFESRYPQFSVAKKSPRPAVKIWEWKAGPDLVFFAALTAISKEDSFAIDIAWNDDRELPWGEFKVEPTDAPRGRTRLGSLWKPQGSDPLWDAAPEVRAATWARLEARSRGETVTYEDLPSLEIVLPRIAPLVDDAIAKLKQYANPVFAEVARHHGVDPAPFR
jgi:hypothetical protein